MAVSSSDILELTCGIEKDEMKVADITASSDLVVDLYTWIDSYDSLAVSNSDHLELTYGIENDEGRMKVAYITVLPDFIYLGGRFLHLD